MNKILTSTSARDLAKNFILSYSSLTRILNFKVNSTLAVKTRAHALLSNKCQIV